MPDSLRCPARWCAAMLGLACALLGVLPHGAPYGMAQAAEAQDFVVTGVLGSIEPIDSRQGRNSPTIVVLHKSDGYYGDGTFTFNYFSSVAETAMRHPLARLLDVSYGARGEFISAFKGLDVYREGVRQTRRSFNAESLEALLTAHLFPRVGWQVDVGLERLWSSFREREGETDRAFVLPVDFVRDALRVTGRRVGLLGAADGELSLTLLDARRDQWEPWSLDPAQVERTTHGTAEARWHQPVAWSEHQFSILELRGLTGRDLDFLSAFRIGGFAGDYPVAGYYRNEYRATEAVLLSVEHTMVLSQGRELTLGVDGAWLKTLPLPEDEPDFQALAGLRAAWFHPIQALGGLPVILRYGEGLIIPEGSPEQYRRELFLGVAFGF